MIGDARSKRLQSNKLIENKDGTENRRYHEEDENREDQSSL
jgi:hypothetical protein